MVRGSKAHAGGGGRAAPRSMFETFALEPIWRAYSVCDGEEVQVSSEGGMYVWGAGEAQVSSERGVYVREVCGEGRRHRSAVRGAQGRCVRRGGRRLGLKGEGCGQAECGGGGARKVWGRRRRSAVQGGGGGRQGAGGQCVSGGGSTG